MPSAPVDGLYDVPPDKQSTFCIVARNSLNLPAACRYRDERRQSNCARCPTARRLVPQCFSATDPAYEGGHILVKWLHPRRCDAIRGIDSTF